MQDKLLMDDGQKWLYKNKEHGIMSATASIGLILLWDVDGGLTQIDKYLYSPEDYIKAGALLACGIVNTGVRNGEYLVSVAAVLVPIAFVNTLVTQNLLTAQDHFANLLCR